LRDVPVLVMGALSEIELSEALGARAEVVIWSEAGLDAVVGAGGGRVHVKLDSGMGRLGTRDPDRASEVVELAVATEEVELVGAMTHFATADDRVDGFFERQLEVFDRWVQEVKREHPHVIVHAANSAAVLRERRSHFDMVRCGIAIYGMDPFGEDPDAVGLEPALELVSYVAEVKACAAGQSAGYGRRFIADTDTHLGVLPIGYGDGWRRGLSGDADVLVQGTRRPLVGTVSMDNLTIDLGDGPDAASLCGSETVLLGAQGEQRILAEEVAKRLHTINYEVSCALTARVPRLFHRDGTPAPDEQ
jgi:alanine racemase